VVLLSQVQSLGVRVGGPLYDMRGPKIIIRN